MIEFWKSLFFQVSYFQSGNYLSIKKIIEESHRYAYSGKGNITLHYEVFRLLDMIGAIEVSDHSSQIRWSSNWQIDSYECLNFLDTFRPGSENNKDRINFKFIDGSFDFSFSKDLFFNDKSQEIEFHKFFSNAMPTFSEVIESCTVSRTWNEYLSDQNVDLFDFKNNRWLETPSYLVADTSLIRRKLELGNYEIMLVLPQKNIARMINSPEWSFVILMKYLKLNLDHLKSVSGLTIKMPTRLPSLFYRRLLIDSNTVHLDYGIKFQLGSNNPVAFFNNWLGNYNVDL